MADTVPCPGCQAQLTLPSLPEGQTVQCPRCKRVFKPGDRPASAGTPSGTATTVAATVDHDLLEPTFIVGMGQAMPPATDLHDLLETPRRVMPVESLIAPWLAYFTMMAIGASALTFVMRAYAEFDQQLHGQFRFVRQVEFWQSASAWVALPSFAIWLFVAARNARVLRASGFSLTPGWVLAIFCCPIANVIFAYLNLQEIWRASDPERIEDLQSWKQSPPSLMVRFWGLSVVCAAAVLLFVASHFDRAGREFDVMERWLICIVNLNVAVAGGLLIAIVQAIAARQQRRYIRLYEDPD